MKNSKSLLTKAMATVAIISFTLVGLARAEPNSQVINAVIPTTISYQGQIWDGTTPYDGTGFFKFAILDSTSKQTWSNDGEEPPISSVSLEVNSGLFNVLLGDDKIGMSPLNEKVFEDPITFLIVWFSPDGSTWTELPEQRISVVPYAFNAVISAYASESGTADLLDGFNSDWFDGGTVPLNDHVSSFEVFADQTCGEGYVVGLWDEPNYVGAPVPLPAAGSYDLWDFNDAASSIQIDANWSARVYRDFYLKGPS